MNSELAVIGAVINEDDITPLLQVNTYDLFKTNSDVVEFLVTYYQKNRCLPPKSLVEDKFVIDIPESVGTVAHHMEQLRTRYVNQKVKAMLRTASTAVQNGDTAAAITSITREISSIKEMSTDIRDMDAVDIDDAIKHFIKVQELHAMGSYGVQVGIPGIDDFLPSGIVPGMLGLILGYPGRGKSFLSALMSVNAWDRGKNVLYVSLEMTEPEMRARIYTIAGRGQWSLRDLQRGQVNVKEFEAWAVERFEERPNFPVISNDIYGPFTPNVLRSKIEQYKPDIIFVDYLQLMSPDSGGGDSETIKLKNLSRELKILAMTSSVPVVGVVSATPSDATDMNGVPELGQVAWSKQLAYDADFVLAVGRPDDSNILEVAFRKNRNGPLFSFGLECDFDRGIFEYTEVDFSDDI